MIKSIYLKNFMSHTDTHIKLNEKLNVIIGKNDVGKSAVLHALRWFLTNEPRGNNFITIGKKAARVAIEVDDAILIKERTSSQTKFMIESFGEVVDTYYKTEIPDEFLDILEIKTVTKFGNFDAELNFIFQHDSYFMLSDSGSVGAQVLGKLAGTDPIDLASKDLKKETFSLASDLRMLKQDIDNVNDEIRGYDYLDKLKEQYSAIDTEFILTKKAADRCQELVELQTNYSTEYLEYEKVGKLFAKYYSIYVYVEELDRVIENSEKIGALKQLQAIYKIEKLAVDQLEDLLQPLENLEDVSQLADKIDNDIKDFSYLFQLSSRHSVEESSLNTLTKKLSNYNELERIESSIDITLVLIDNSINMNNLYSRLKMSTTSINELSEKLVSYNNNLTGANLNAAEDQNDKYGSLLQLESKYLKVQQQYSDMFEASSNAAKHYVIKQEVLDNLWSSLEVCPLCEQKIN